MTDRYCALTVVLDRDIRDDDAEAIIGAIKMLRGVLSVQPHVSDYQTLVAVDRARSELVQALWKVLEKKS